jgi:hypothetical protein
MTADEFRLGSPHMAKKTKWVVTTSQEKPLGEVSKALTKAGFEVEKVLKEIGCITGSATADVAKKAEKIPGVSNVSADTPVDIGPPGSPETW